MKQWTRLPTGEHCGGCGAAIAEDTPICIVWASESVPQRRLLRCVACAGPPPDDLIAPHVDRQRAQRRDAMERLKDKLVDAPREWVPYADKE